MAAAILPLSSEATAPMTQTAQGPTAPMTTVPHDVVQSRLPTPKNHEQTSDNKGTAEIKKGITWLKIRAGVSIAISVICALVAGFFIAMGLGLFG